MITKLENAHKLDASFDTHMESRKREHQRQRQDNGIWEGLDNLDSSGSDEL